MGPEAKLEKKVREAVAAAGGIAVKLGSPAGMPDRLIILPGQKAPRYIFVEMKAERGKLSAIQERRIRQLEALGCDVRVVQGAEETQEFVESIRT